MIKPKIVTIGSATFDLFAKAHDSAILRFDRPQGKEAWLGIEYGGKLSLDEIHETFGGGATNTAVGFARMGFDVACLAKVGIPYGDRVIENLRAEGVDVGSISFTKSDRTGFSIVLNSFEGERTVLYHRGANAFFSKNDLPLKLLGSSDWIFLNHVSSKAAAIHDSIADLLKKNPHLRLCWNPGHEQLKEGARHWQSLLKHTGILFLNKQEAAEFSRKSYYGHAVAPEAKDRHVRPCQKKKCLFADSKADDLRSIFLELLRYGPKIVVITDGQNGAQATDGKHLYYCPILEQDRVDTLGAGDAFASGFTSAILLKHQLKNALICGTINAASVVQYYGAQAGLLSRQKLLHSFKSHTLRVREATLR